MRPLGRIAGAFTIVIALSAVAACADGSRPSASERLQQIGREMTALRSETVQHGEAIASAPGLYSIPQAEAAHDAAVDEYQEVMMGEMDGLIEMCGAMGAGVHMADFERDLSGIGDECRTHRVTMDVAGDMASAQSEEARHQKFMFGMLDTMETIRQAMMHSSTEPTCGGGDGK